MLMFAKEILNCVDSQAGGVRMDSIILRWLLCRNEPPFPCSHNSCWQRVAVENDCGCQALIFYLLIREG